MIMDTATRNWIEEVTAGEPPWPAVEPSPRWVRVKLAGETVADTRDAMLLIQYGRPPTLPTYYFPASDVASELLVNPEARDGSTFWTVAVNGESVSDGAWTHPDPGGKLSPLQGMITFDWWSDLQWFEEEERVFAHARDPHKRVDVLPSSRHVEVSIDGVALADSKQPILLFETMLPTRYYVPREDVRMDLLTPTDSTSLCPYKGKARYWSFHGEEGEHRDIAWSYPDPVPENPRIRDLVCFYNEMVDLTVDGEPLERPLTPWSV